ncbi:hypothetical protein CY652_13635 [Burkholderia sp. WAC0059]|nr:hypothetical protein CY652_13635 [Burkholderia sp. WAC0059]
MPTGHNRGGFRYFRHEQPADDERCALTTSSYQLPGMSVGYVRDPMVELRYRRRFLQQWQWHYRRVREVTPWFSLPLFTRMIEYADVMNLWSYPALRLDDAPYVLLVMAGFISTRTASGELTRERFWFDGSVADVGDLWSAGRTVPATLFRVVYRAPLQTPLPTAASIMYWEPVRQVTRLADISVPRVSRSELKSFARFLERYEAQRRTRLSGVSEDWL